MIAVLYICLKTIVFFAIVACIHATTTRDVVDLYGRPRLALVGLGALLLGLFSNWFLSGPYLFEWSFWTALAIADHLAVAALAFGIGLLIQVVRFRGADAEPSCRRQMKIR